MTIIAGHEFEGIASDRRCIRKLGNGQECGKFWIDVRGATENDVGKPELSHTPNLTTNELSEIRAEVAREEARYSMAFAR